MKDQQLYARWLEARREQWQSLSRNLQGSKADRSLEQAREVLDGYRGLARDVALARRQAPGTAMHKTAEALYAQTFDAIHRRRSHPLQDLWELFAVRVPTAVRRLRSELFVTFGLFAVTGIAGYLLVSQWRETAQWFMSDQMMLMVQNGTLWTDGLLNVMPSSMLSMELMTNNITVALTAFALGLLYGIGTLYIISLNGFMLGAVFGYVVQYQMGLPLFRFIIAHGIVELSVICIAGAAGMALGRALARPGPLGRIAALREAAPDAGALASLCVPFLIGSGIIEGYVSPNDGFSLLSRCVIGVLWFAVLLAFMHGGLLRHLGQMLRSARN